MVKKLKLFLREKRIKAVVKENESLASYANYGVGGNALAYVKPYTIKDMELLIRFFNDENITYFIIGEGSDLLIDEKKYNGVVMELPEETKKLSFFNKRLITGAKVSTSFIGKFLFKKGRKEFSELINVPGTIGGAIKTNARFLGHTIIDYLDYLVVMDKNGTVRFENGEDYKNGEEFILTATFLLKDEKHSFNIKTGSKKIMKRSLKFIKGKDEKWREIVKETYVFGDAVIKPEYPGIILNRGKASFSDTMHLMEFFDEKIGADYGIKSEVSVIA